jgi:hypothetical protein
MVRDEASKKPHQLDITTRLTFKAAARLHPIEISVDVQLSSLFCSLVRTSFARAMTSEKCQELPLRRAISKDCIGPKAACLLSERLRQKADLHPRGIDGGLRPIFVQSGRSVVSKAVTRSHCV